MTLLSAACAQQGHSRIHPLELPEIVVLLGKHLSPAEVTACLRVCRLWYHTLLPRIWANIEFLSSEESRLPLRIGPVHSALVRRIYARNHDRGEVFFPNLADLVLSRVMDGSEATVELVHRHRHTLVGLSTEQTLSAKFLEAIIGCQKLKVLNLWKAPLPECSGQWIRVYEKLWSRLEILCLGGPWFDQDDSEADLMDQSLPSARIRELTIHGTSYDSIKVQDCHLWLIKRCNLNHLRWYTRSPEREREKNPMHFLAREVRLSPNCSWMMKLKFLDFPLQPFYLKDFATVIEWIPRLTGLCLFRSSFNLDAWAILRDLSPRHLKTLRVLKLGHCYNLPGSAIQSILCSMPKLEVFKGPMISVSDILNDDQPWLCRGLKKLCLGFNFDGPTSAHALVLSRLSEMVELESLNMYSSRDIYLTLSACDHPGLDLLKTLGRLGSFVGGFSDPEPTWSVEEALWVQANWPKLRKLVQVNTTDEAREILKSCKVKIVERYSDN